MHELAIRKSYKWWKKILFRLLLQSALSAHKLHQSAGSSRDFLFFLHDCITTMIAKAPRLSTTAGSGLDSVARLTGRDHFFNSFPVIRTANAKNRRFHVPQPTFLFPLETTLRLSRNELHGWKGNSMLAKPLAACSYLSSIVSELYDA